jgi:hypothetical protein
MTAFRKVSETSGPRHSWLCLELKFDLWIVTLQIRRSVHKSRWVDFVCCQPRSIASACGHRRDIREISKDSTTIFDEHLSAQNAALLIQPLAVPTTPFLTAFDGCSTLRCLSTRMSAQSCASLKSSRSFLLLPRTPRWSPSKQASVRFSRSQF